MLDIRRIRSNPDAVLAGLEKRKGSYPIKELLELDKKRREILTQAEEMKMNQNKISKEVPKLKQEGKDTSEIFEEMKKLSDRIKEYDTEIKAVDGAIAEYLLAIPNIPCESVEVGESDADNVEIRKFMDVPKFDFEIKAHWDLGKDLDILDFDRAVKISSSRFSIFKGDGAALERALIQFMLNTHTREHSYIEMSTPFMVNGESMTGTGQLPKFEEDMFKISDSDMYLVPTAEVPLTNMYRDDIIDYEKLPLYITEYTPCFRREAGSAGRDTRGLIRNHQFDKVELVKFTSKESSYDELEKLTSDAEDILKALKLPYRVVRLCTGDLGFSSAMTYDIEVWMPSYNRYVEISSCSNFEDFQARRANIKTRNKDGKLEFVHTLNGSGLAVGRCFAAVLENYQNADGSVDIPEVLRPYMGKDKIENK